MTQKYLRIEGASFSNVQAEAATAGTQGWRPSVTDKTSAGLRLEQSGTGESVISFDGDTGDMTNTAGRDGGATKLWTILMEMTGSGAIEIRVV